MKCGGESPQSKSHSPLGIHSTSTTSLSSCTLRSALLSRLASYPSLPPPPIDFSFPLLPPSSSILSFPSSSQESSHSRGSIRESLDIFQESIFSIRGDRELVTCLMGRVK